MSLEMDPYHMRIDIKQWAAAASSMGSARSEIDPTLDWAPKFGWFDDVIGKPYRQATEAVGEFVHGGQTTFTAISGALNAALEENLRRDEQSAKKIASVRPAGPAGATGAVHGTKYDTRLGGQEGPR